MVLPSQFDKSLTCIDKGHSIVDRFLSVQFERLAHVWEGLLPFERSTQVAVCPHYT